MEPYLGLIKLYPFTFAPVGWMLCNGAIMQIAEYQTLYSLIGIRFGGDGSSTFKLPNMINTAPTSPNASVQTMAYYIAVQGLYPTRP